MRETGRKKEADGPILLSSSDIICCATGSLNSNKSSTRNAGLRFSLPPSEGNKQNNIDSRARLLKTAVDFLYQNPLKVLSKSWLHADFIMITSDLSKAIHDQKFVQNIMFVCFSVLSKLICECQKKPSKNLQTTGK